MLQKLIGILGLLAMVTKYFQGKYEEERDQALLKQKAPGSTKE